MIKAFYKAHPKNHLAFQRRFYPATYDRNLYMGVLVTELLDQKTRIKRDLVILPAQKKHFPLIDREGF